MVARANIVINDGATSPAAHTFSPIGKPGGSEYDFYVERTSGKPEFQAEVRVRTQIARSVGAPYKVFVSMILPKTVTVDSVESLDRQNRVDVTFTLASKGVTQDRKDLRVLLSNLLGNAQLIGIVDNLEALT